MGYDKDGPTLKNVVAGEMMLPSKFRGTPRSEFLPQLPQDEFLLSVRYAAPPPEICQIEGWEFKCLGVSELLF